MKIEETKPLGLLLRCPPRYGINAAAVPLAPGTPTYLRITDIDDSGRFAPDPKVGVAHPNALSYRLKPGELVFARTGASVGKSYLYNPQDGELIYAGFLINVAPDPALLNPKFLSLVVQMKEYWDWIARTSVRSGQPGVNGREFASLPIPVVHISIQDAIADAMTDVDDMISNLERLIAKKQWIKQGMMQQLLTGKTRLPGFTGEWRSRRLGELLSYEQPSRFLVKTSKQLESGSVPVLTAGKTFILGYTNEAHGIYRSHPVIIFDDFTTASKYVDFDFKAKSSAMKILSARSGVDLRFVYERMQLIDFPMGDHKRYWISEYSKQELLMPEENEQVAIANVLADTDVEISTLRDRLEKSLRIKQGMMQDLLTGRTRLQLMEMTP